MTNPQDRTARRLRSAAVVMIAAVALSAGGAWQAAAQLFPPLTQPNGETFPPLTLFPPPTTAPTTTAPPPVDSTTTAPAAAPPSSDAGAAADATSGADGGDGDIAGRIVPADAQRRINSQPRSRPNDASALVSGVNELEALGVAHDEAVRAVYGRFPIAGYARWSDDWLLPRWTGTVFRYHLGCDMFAEYGTPVRAPADGVATISTSELGGLAVRVTEASGTYYYMAHLSGVADGLRSGQQVAVGDIVGFVGDSGNARGGSPHLHIGIHPRGGEAAPPKPILDEMVAEAVAALPDVIAAYKANQNRALVATQLVRQLGDAVPVGADAAVAVPPRSELFFASSANPAGGGVQLAEASASAAAQTMDWEQHALEQQAFSTAWQQSSARAWTLLSPLMAAPMRHTLGAG